MIDVRKKKAIEHDPLSNYFKLMSGSIYLRMSRVSSTCVRRLAVGVKCYKEKLRKSILKQIMRVPQMNHSIIIIIIVVLVDFCSIFA